MSMKQRFFATINRVLWRLGYQIQRVEPRRPRPVFARGDFLNWLDAHPPAAAPRIILDVGAADGVVASHLAARYPAATIHCFEPSRPFQESLHKVAAAWAPRLIVQSRPLSEFPGTGLLHCHRDAQTNALHPAASDAAQTWPDGRFDVQETVPVEIDTVDAYCERMGIAHIDLLKIDAQGEDLRILRGAAGLLCGQRIERVIVEGYFVPVYQEQGQPEEIVRWLRGWGYVPLVYLVHDVGEHGELRCADMVFGIGSRQSAGESLPGGARIADSLSPG